MRGKLRIGIQRGQHTIYEQLTGLYIQSATRINITETILCQETSHILPHASGHILHFTGDFVPVERILNRIPFFVTLLLGHLSLRFERQGDSSLLKHAVDHTDGIECLGKSDERGTLIYGFPQLHRSYSHVQSRRSVCLQLRQRLHYGKCRTGDQLPCLVIEIAYRKDLSKNKFLKNGHKLRIRTLSRQGLSSKQSGVVLSTNIDSVHAFLLFLCGCRTYHNDKQQNYD